MKLLKRVSLKGDGEMGQEEPTANALHRLAAPSLNHTYGSLMAANGERQERCWRPRCQGSAVTWAMMMNEWDGGARRGVTPETGSLRATTSLPAISLSISVPSCATGGPTH